MGTTHYRQPCGCEVNVHLDMNGKESATIDFCGTHKMAYELYDALRKLRKRIIRSGGTTVWATANDPDLVLADFALMGVYLNSKCQHKFAFDGDNIVCIHCGWYPEAPVIVSLLNDNWRGVSKKD